MGRRSVTVRAGRFVAEHFRRLTKSGQEDVWVSKEVAGWPVVRVRTRQIELELESWGTDAKTDLTGSPIDMHPQLRRQLGFDSRPRSK